MKNIITLLLIMILAQSLITAQIPVQSEKIVTDFINGEKNIVKGFVIPEINNDSFKVVNTNSKSGLIWEAEAEWAICKSVGISDETYHSYIGWHTNDEAWAFFGETNNIPVWTYDINGAEELPHDITSDGTYMVGATGNTVYGFISASGTPDWIYTISNSGDDIFNIVISGDGETVYYVSGDDYDYSYITSVDISTSVVNWNFSLPEGGYGVQLVLSANDERLLIEKYYSTIVYSNNGDVLFDITRTTGAGAAPAVSDDGNIFVIGDYHGYATVYEYNEISEIYEEKWQYLFEGGSSYDWVNAIAVSGDGRTIAAGSLRFEGGGIYSGELAVFDTTSNEPLWIYQSVNDALTAIDISQTGSLIAAASYGPLDDNGDDFWLFNRTGNEPVFAFTCQGSPFDIDLSADGTKCIVGGKAIHARVSGHGGKLYYFDLNPTLYSVSGTVTDINTNAQLEGALITIGTSYTNTTNSSGFYNIEDVTAGTYTLTCELTGYETYTTEINVEGDETINIELQNSSGIDNPFVLQKNISVTNYPNPFKSETTINYSIPVSSNVIIEIYDIQGKKIKTLVNEYHALGNHSVVWNGTNENEIPTGTGIYFYRLKTDNNIVLKKIILIK